MVAGFGLQECLDGVAHLIVGTLSQSQVRFDTDFGVLLDVLQDRDGAVTQLILARIRQERLQSRHSNPIRRLLILRYGGDLRQNLVVQMANISQRFKNENKIILLLPVGRFSIPELRNQRLRQTINSGDVLARVLSTKPSSEVTNPQVGHPRKMRLVEKRRRRGNRVFGGMPHRRQPQIHQVLLHLVEFPVLQKLDRHFDVVTVAGTQQRIQEDLLRRHFIRKADSSLNLTVHRQKVVFLANPQDFHQVQELLRRVFANHDVDGLGHLAHGREDAVDARVRRVDVMGVLEDDGPRLTHLDLRVVFGGADVLQDGFDGRFGAVVAHGEGDVEVVLVDGGLVEDAVLHPELGVVVAVENRAGFDFAVEVEGGGEEVLLDGLAVGTSVEIARLLDHQDVAFFVLGDFGVAETEHVGFVAALQVGLEDGSDGSLEIQRVLGVSRCGANTVFEVAVVEVDPDGFVHVWNVGVFLESEGLERVTIWVKGYFSVVADDLDVLQSDDLVALGLLGQ